jgi:ATPase subunit of ABC transporter with duplicated ATPase domains
VALEAGTLRSYVGGWPEYVRAREERARSTAPRPAKPRKAPRARREPDDARNQQRLEREIESAEATLHALEQELADPAAWSGPEASARSAARHEQAKRAVEQLYEELERVTYP